MKNLLLQLFMVAKLVFYGVLLQCLSFSMLLAHEGSAQDIKSVKELNISVRFDENTITEVFEIIEDNTGYHFVYDNALLADRTRFSKTYHQNLVAEILLDVSRQYGLRFKQFNKSIVVSNADGTINDNVIVVQEKEITGRVTSKDSPEGLPGVNVIIKGTSQGTVTDIDGNYSIDVPSENAVLVFSSVGYVKEEVQVGNRSVINMDLVPDITALEEIVVVGYGTSKKKDLTGSVSQVKADKLSQSISSSVDDLLKGRVTGLQVLSSSGEPGTGSTIRIRGSNSFAGGSDPLLVVDGIPVGTAGNLKQINPQDIESIDVLKDASAAAIYGSRGANGVIIVTTKKGEPNQHTIEANYQMGVSTLPKPFDIIADPYLYAQLDNEANANRDEITGENTVRYVGEVNPLDGVYYPSLGEIQSGEWPYSTYWPDVIFRDAITHNYSVATRGGTESTTYAISLGYLDQEGMVKGNEYNKYTLNSNLEQDIKDNIKAGLNVNLAFIDATKSSTDWTGGPQNAIGRSPVFPAVDSTGQYVLFGNQDFGNPLAIRENITNNSRTFDLFGSGFVDWEIIEGLNFRSSLRTTYGQSITDLYEPIGFGGAGHQYDGQGEIRNYNGFKWVADNYLTYKRIFREKHNLTAMVGTSFEKFTLRTSNLIGRGFVNDNLTNEDLAGADTRTVENDSYTLKLFSAMGRVNYIYDERYLLTMTMRADGSSKFGSNNKYGYFPSAAVAWNVHNESFFPQTDVLSRLKMRAGYGITGNQSALQPFMTLDRLGNEMYWIDGSWGQGYGPGYIIGTDQQGRPTYAGIANKSLKWETTNQFNVGLDIGVFNDRIQLSADYYNKYTYDLLRYAVINASSGYHRQWQNDGEVLNKGYEIVVDASVIKKRDFSWNIGFNISHNENKVEKVEEQTATYEGREYIIPQATGNEVEAFRSFPNFLSVGKPMFVFYGYKTDGIIQTQEEGLEAGLTGEEALPGEIKYIDTDGNGVVNDFDRDFIGDPTPDFFGGFNTSVNYKNWNLGLFLTYSVGGDVYNMQKLNQGSSRYKRWTVDNPNNEYPSLRAGRFTRFSDYFIEDGSYVKLQNVSLSYELPLNASFVQSLSVNANVENALVMSEFSGYDPEVGLNGLYWGSGYPRPRQYTVGLKLTF